MCFLSGVMSLKLFSEKVTGVCSLRQIFPALSLFAKARCSLIAVLCYATKALRERYVSFVGCFVIETFRERSVFFLRHILWHCTEALGESGLLFTCVRCYVSVTVHDCYLYALGGFDGRARQRSAERFHPASNQWSMIQPMLCPRSDGGATTLNGGSGGQDGVFEIMIASLL